MRTIPVFPRLAAARVRGLSLAGLLLTTTCPAAFAAEADLSLTASAEPALVVVGGELQFHLGLVNNGPNDAEDATVEIEVPAEVSLVAATPSQGTCLTGPPLTCRLGTVGSDYPANHVAISVTTVPNGVSGIVLTALATSTTPDPFPDNDTATTWSHSVELAQAADLRVEPQILPSLAFSGATMEFVINVANGGPALAGVVEVQVGARELDLGSFVSASSTQGQCSTALEGCVGLQCLEVLSNPLAVSCDLGGMAAGGTATVRVGARIDLPAETSLTVSARIEAPDTADADPSNNAVAAEVPVVEVPGGGAEGPPILSVGEGSLGPGGCFVQSLLF